MRKTYNKLIRDRIPEIMDAAGVEDRVSVMTEAEYRRALLDKVLEEAREVAAASPTEIVKEIADLQEVLEALLRAINLTPEELETLRAQRRAERGGSPQPRGYTSRKSSKICQPTPCGVVSSFCCSVSASHGTIPAGSSSGLSSTVMAVS